MFYGLTTLGTVHTAISLVAVVAGIVALARDKEIGPRSGAGHLYIWATVLTAVTSFGIFQHGGFGKPHALGVITLAALALAWMAGRGKLGAWSRYIEVVSYSATFLFHWIPAITETTTRLPIGAPWLDSPEAPQLKAATGVLVLLFLLGAGWQVMRMRKTPAAPALMA